MKSKVLSFLILSLLWFSCKTRFNVVSSQNESYKVVHVQADTLSEIELLLKPYRDSMTAQMSIPLGIATADFKKEKPSGSLGNLVADAMMAEAQQRNMNADAGIYNHGGVRINELKQGQITVGKIYELLPFENELVILELPGNILLKWFELIVKSGGWPLSKEVKIQFEKEAQIFLIKSPNTNDGMQYKAIDARKMYRIVTNDYVANGGDQCDFLKDLKKINTGKLIRELMMDYIRNQQKISPDNQPRINLIK